MPTKTPLTRREWREREFGPRTGDIPTRTSAVPVTRTSSVPSAYTGVLPRTTNAIASSATGFVGSSAFPEQPIGSERHVVTGELRAQSYRDAAVSGGELATTVPARNNLSDSASYIKQTRRSRHVRASLGAEGRDRIVDDSVGGKRKAPRVARKLAGGVAMGFVVMLAVATSVPALSLLAPDDVQAIVQAKSSTAAPDEIAAKQTVDTAQGGDGDGLSGGPGIQVESYQSQTIEQYTKQAGIRPEAGSFTNDPKGSVQWPFPVGVHIGDRFGYRNCSGCSSNHHGQDFNPGFGAQIQAIADGVVVQSTDDGGSLGVMMAIEHQIDGKKVASVYAHMIEGSRKFSVGDHVKVADVIGRVGSTGMSTGPHLHFEIREGGWNGTWVDPLIWLQNNTN